MAPACTCCSSLEVTWPPSNNHSFKKVILKALGRYCHLPDLLTLLRGSPACFVMRNRGMRSLVWPGLSCASLIEPSPIRLHLLLQQSGGGVSVEVRSLCLYLDLHLHHYFGCLCTYVLKGPNGCLVQLDRCKRGTCSHKKENLLLTSGWPVLKSSSPSYVNAHVCKYTNEAEGG